MGNTSLYGEYGRAKDYLGANAVGVVDTDTSDVKFYGVGIVQQIDAAAMEVFLGWRRFDVDTNVALPTDPDKLDLVHGGARVRF